jgi:hypothetical protein
LLEHTPVHFSLIDDKNLERNLQEFSFQGSENITPAPARVLGRTPTSFL